MAVASGPPPTRRQRAVRGIRAFLALALYLWLCLGAILLYRPALLAEHGVGGWHLGLAAAKALLLAKFILLGQHARLGESRRARTPLRAVVEKSLLFLLLILLLAALEEAVLGAVYGRGLAATAATMGRHRLEIAASCLLLWLVLLPYLAFRQLTERVGPEGGRSLLHGKL